MGRGGVGNLTCELPYSESAIYSHGAGHLHGTRAHDTSNISRGGMGNISRDHSSVRV
jgi:hypothetical protein